MYLRYVGADGLTQEYRLSGDSVTIGRSPEADIVLQDEKASRLHCGLRFENGGYYVKDLKSKNGTYLNEAQIDSEPLAPGDRIRVGAVVFRFEEDRVKGPNTVLHEVEEEMAGGKGYGTILREIVDDTDE